MHRIRFHTTFFFLVIVQLLAFCHSEVRAADVNILVIHSYHQEYPWTKHENEGFVTTLRELLENRDIGFSTEYLDTKRVRMTREYRNFFTAYLKEKYSGYSPDIIFVSDDNALMYVVSQRENLFPGTPVVFCGVNDTSFSSPPTPAAVSGVYEVKDIEANLQLITKLFPDIQEVTFVGDGSETYNTIYQQILIAAATRFPNYDLKFYAHRSFDQVANLLKALPGKVIVLTTIGGFINQDGRVMSIADVVRSLRMLGDFAIISMEDVYILEGVLGGVVTSGNEQGSSAAAIAAKILSADVASPGEQTFIIGNSIPTFDYNELQRLGFSTSQLPSPANLLNAPPSLYKELRQTVITAAAAITLLSILLVVMYINFSRKRRAEKELRASQRFLTSVLDNLPDIVFVKSASDLRFVRLNKAGERIFGATAENVIGKTDYDFFPPSEADFFTQKDREALSNKMLIDIPVEPINEGKGKRYLHTKKIPILDEDGRPLFLLGISRDITDERIALKERKLLEERLSQAQKMESIGTLAGGIAHDFNNILSSIIGYTELARLNEECPPAVRNMLDGTLKGTERAKQLVRQILAFSKKQDQQRKPIVLAEVVQECLTLLSSTLPSTITIRSELHSHNRVLADPTQLHQVVMNLCTNGYQAMQDEGGLLLVNLYHIRSSEIERVVPGSVKEGEYLHFAVTDSGKGIKEEVISRIFDPYYTTKGPEAGTGLGLAVVHGIVKSHEGYISVDSEPKGGTTISVFLPVLGMETDIEEIPYTEEHIPLKNGQGQSILFIDDEQDIVTMSTQYLEDHGYKVSSFTESEQALQEYVKNWQNYDLVITDMTMPNLTGDILAREILLVNPDALIIICTGYSRTMTREKAEAIGIKAFCEKPVSLTHLLETINRTFDQNI